MEHVFILNPAAGKGNLSQLQQRIVSSCAVHHLHPILHVTQSREEGESFVRATAAQGKPVRFYACGGDGTLHMVLNGCYGFPNTQLAVIPVGSGNDFVRSFPQGKAAFLQLDDQLSGSVVPLDVIQFNQRYAMNLCNIGWDCDICRRTNRLKTIPFLKGEAAYLLAVGYSMFCSFGKELRLTFPDGSGYEGKMVLTAIGNGSWYGGGFCASPRAIMNDGLMEISTISNVSRLKIACMIGYYKKGQHLDMDSFQPLLRYQRASWVKIESPSPFEVCADGEISRVEQAEFSIPGKIPFLIPRGVSLKSEEPQKQQQFLFSRCPQGHGQEEPLENGAAILF